MAGVPQYGAAKVDPTGPNDERFVTPDTSGMAENGRQLSRFGQTLEESGRQLGKIFQAEQEKANDLRVIDAENKAREAAIRLTVDEKEGFARIQGSGVLDVDGKPLAETYRERFTQELGKIGATLSNEAQRQAFQRSAAAIGQSFYASAKEHEATEYRGWQQSVVKGSAELAGQEIALHYTDQDFIDKRLGTLDVAVAKLAALQGASGEATSAAQNTARSTALYGAVAAAFDAGDITTAQTLFNRYKDKLLAPDKAKIEGPLKRETEGKLALSAVSDALDGAAGDSEASPSYHTPAAPEPGEKINYMFPLLHPGQTVPGGEYGAARSYGGHSGRDYANPPGTDVHAPGDGVVEKVWRSKAGGLQMGIRLADGSHHGFAHLSAANYEEGKRVTMGQIVAQSGDSGTPGHPHLHYTVRLAGGQTIDPKNYKPGVAAASHSSAIASAPVGSADSRVGAWQRVVAKLGPNPSLDLIKTARAEFDYQWSARKADEREADDKSLGNAFTELMKNGGNVSGLSAATRRSLRGDQWDSVLAFAGSVRSYNNPDSQPGAREARQRHDDSMYNFAITHPEVLRDVSTPNFLQKYAGHPKFEELAKYRGQLRGEIPVGGKDNPGDLSYETINRTVDARLQAIGMDPKDDKKVEQIGAVRRIINGAVAGEQRRLGRQLTDAETESFIDRQFAKTRTIHNYVLGIHTSDREVPVFQIEVSQINKATLKEIDAALDRAGQPKTDANRLTVYYRMMGDNG